MYSFKTASFFSFQKRGIFVRLYALSAVVFALLSAVCPAAASAEIKILCSTFPICQITRNVTEGRKGASVQPLLPSTLGCPHDYALSPRDMQKLAKADIMVVNGLGMEEYLGSPVERANPLIKIIDSSEGISDLLHYFDFHSDVGEKNRHSGALNPHLFASPRMAAKLALNIAAKLSELDPDGAAVYGSNARSYADKMNRLADEFSALVEKLSNNRIAVQHGVFDYLARDSGLRVAAVLEEHPGREPSAAEILKLVKTIQEENVGAVFSEPQYPARVAETIAKEAGVAAAELDPVASGPENAPFDYYETVMRKNMQILESVLGK